MTWTVLQENIFFDGGGGGVFVDFKQIDREDKYACIV